MSVYNVPEAGIAPSEIHRVLEKAHLFASCSLSHSMFGVPFVLKTKPHCDTVLSWLTHFQLLFHSLTHSLTQPFTDKECERKRKLLLRWVGSCVLVARSNPYSFCSPKLLRLYLSLCLQLTRFVFFWGAFVLFCWSFQQFEDDGDWETDPEPANVQVHDSRLEEPVTLDQLRKEVHAEADRLREESRHSSQKY